MSEGTLTDRTTSAPSPVAHRTARESGRVLGIVVVLAVAGVLAWKFLPNFRETVRQQIEKVGGWNDEARRGDPAGFIDFSIQKLTDNVGKFGQVQQDLARAKAKLTQLHDDNNNKFVFAGKQLDEFKKAFKEAAGGKGWPAQIAGKSYSEAELKSQVNVLLTQKAAYESVLKQTQTGLDTTGKRELEIIGRVTESKAKLDLLRTQRELVKVAKISADTEKILGEVHDVLVQNEAIEAENPVRTVEELMKQAETSTPAANANVDAFLNG